MECFSLFSDYHSYYGAAVSGSFFSLFVMPLWCTCSCIHTQNNNRLSYIFVYNRHNKQKGGAGAATRQKEELSSMPLWPGYSRPQALPVKPSSQRTHAKVIISHLPVTRPALCHRVDIMPHVPSPPHYLLFLLYPFLFLVQYFFIFGCQYHPFLIFNIKHGNYIFAFLSLLFFISFSSFSYASYFFSVF